MTSYCAENLEDMKSLLKTLSLKEYTAKSDILSGASVGQHVRHVIEFYMCLFKGLESNSAINYDLRERNLLLEEDINASTEALDFICSMLGKGFSDMEVELTGNFSTREDEDFFVIKSTLYRELAYNLEHSIHHQALIKVGLKAMDVENVACDFGLAPATIRYNKQVQST